jgi:hypothetical protein
MEPADKSGQFELGTIPDKDGLARIADQFVPAKEAVGELTVKTPPIAGCFHGIHFPIESTRFARPMQPIVFYVDDLAADGSRGFTESPESVYQNLNALRPALAAEIAESLTARNEVTHTFQAGRYTCILTASLDTGNMFLFLIDLRKDAGLAIALSDGFEDPSVIMDAFYDGITVYDQEYNLVTLVERKVDRSTSADVILKVS